MTRPYKDFLSFCLQLLWKLFFKAWHFRLQIRMKCIDSSLALLRTLKSDEKLYHLFGRILFFFGEFLIKFFKLLFSLLNLFFKNFICGKSFLLPFQHDLFSIQCLFVNLATIENCILVISHCWNFLDLPELGHVIRNFLLGHIFRKFDHFDSPVRNELYCAADCLNLLFTLPLPENVKAKEEKAGEKCWNGVN